MRNVVVLVICLLILFSGTWLFWYSVSSPSYKNMDIRNDKDNVGSIAKALLMYADTHGSFPNLGTMVIDPSGKPVTITNPKLAMKALVWSGLINDPLTFDSIRNGRMTDAQLKNNVDLSCSTLYNDYYYSFGPGVRLMPGSDEICVSVPPNAYPYRSKQVLIVGTCNGSTIETDCSHIEPEKIASMFSTAHQENDRIFMLDGLTDGTETYLVPATD